MIDERFFADQTDYMDILKESDYKWINSEGEDRQLVLFALSTCGFCKRARRFLDDRKLKYKLIYIDEIEIDRKKEIKLDFKNQYNENLRYPALLQNDKLALVGYIDKAWRELLDNQESVIL